MRTVTQRARRVRHVATAGEAVLVVLALTYSLTNDVWALVVWEAVALAYLGAGFVVVWRSAAPAAADDGSLAELPPEAPALTWILPLLSSIVGIHAAVLGLVTSRSGTGDPRGWLLLVSAVGIVAAWCLLHVGFAQAYDAIDRSAEARGRSLAFPEGNARGFLDYLYFSFTIGSTFATSDADTTDGRVRRVVLVHSITSFFFNALVVAVAFQLLQQAVGG